jgi:hypothetical protein
MRDKDQLIRRLIFLIGGLETLAVVVLISVVIASGQLSRRLAWVPIMVFGLPYLTCVVPAVALAFANRYLLLALGLCVLSLPVAFFAFIYA